MTDNTIERIRATAAAIRNAKSVEEAKARAGTVDISARAIAREKAKSCIRRKRHANVLMGLA